MSITHTKVLTGKADKASRSEWDANHKITGTLGSILTFGPNGSLTELLPADLVTPPATPTSAGTISAASQAKLDAIDGTATKLASPKNINGVPFDGSANITINAVDATARATGTGSANGVNTGDQTATTLNYTPAGTGAVTRTSKAKLDQVISPEDFGNSTVGDGVSDNTVALQAALNTGKQVYLPKEKTYAFGTRLTIPTGGGFIGGGKLLMLTGAGKFDSANYADVKDRKIGLWIENANDVVVQAHIALQPFTGTRTANAIYVFNSDNVDLDVEISNFKESEYGLIEWNGSDDGYINAYIHDSYTDTVDTALVRNASPSMQLTGLSVDNNRGASNLNSRRLQFDVRVKNIVMGPNARTRFGRQTDAVNLQGASPANPGSTGHQGRVAAFNVDEAIDIFCDGCTIDMTAQNVMTGVKIIHGATRNIVRATVDNYALFGIFIGGSGGVQGTNENRVYAALSRGGQFEPDAFATYGIRIDDASTQGGHRNYIEMSSQGNTTDLNVHFAIGAGMTENTIVYEGVGSFENGAPGAASNIIRRQRPGIARAFVSANFTVAGDTSVIFNTEDIDLHGEFNTTTGVYTAKSPGVYEIKYKAALSVGAGIGFGSYLRKGGAIISRKSEVNSSGSVQTMGHEHSAIVRLVAGDTLFVRTDGGATGVLHFGGTENTFVEIREV